MDIQKIKLIIWDLDETFWKGVLSDHTETVIPDNLRLIRDMTDAGVINSICSKNDRVQVETKLRALGVWDLFVFVSVNWSPKGDRVRQIIREMNLRSANVLFIDDNAANLAEAEASCPGIMTANVDFLPTLQDFFRSAEKKDSSHERLKQYRVLERKLSFKAELGSNEEFLRQCHIQVSLHRDCAAHLARIEDLIQRSNQLNFTKIRSSADELSDLFQNSDTECGYVEVQDQFGDYGIVGFYAMRDRRLLHFVFSCRTLNMGVEQYVYDLLGRPEITVVGEVSSSLDDPRPDWINQEAADSIQAERGTANGKILIKGPCDMQLMFSFMKESKNILTEFVYVNNRGVSIEQGNHTTHIVESQTLSEAVRQRLVRSLPFGDKGMFRTSVFDSSIQWILLSLFTDANLGLYQELQSGACVAFGEYTNDLTDTENWPGFLEKTLFTANCDFTIDSLEQIRKNFRFLGRLSPAQVMENLAYIYAHISPQAHLVLCLGAELPYEKNTSPAYQDRHLYHQELNRLIRAWASERSRVFLLDTNKYVSRQEDFTNNINHFTKSVYYQLTQDFLSIVNAGGQTLIHSATESDQKKAQFLRKLRRIPNKLCRMLHGK